MIKAMLVTPFPPQPTGLADYAKRILSLTKDQVEWTVAYPEAALPLEGYYCVPISKLRENNFNVPVIYQVGNSPHCEEVIETLLARGGTGLFHETNMHHVLRNKANNSGDWKSYNDHVIHDYGDKSDSFLKVMGKKAKSLSEYDNRLRKNPLVGKLASASSIIAVLSDTAKWEMEKIAQGKPVIRMGFLPDFHKRAEKPEKKNDTVIIGIAGTFHYGRSWKEMVNAVAMLRRTVDCRLLVAGGGWPETDFPWITATGRLPDREFREQIEQFDIAIDLRHHTCGETSASMMDILRSGIPAVVSAEGSFRDIPADAVLRIPSESGAGGAYAALKYLLNNTEVRSAISESAANYFADISDRKKCLAEWLDLLERSTQ
ncbi:MAG: glycosyltransferase [Candidatus Sabulitectum sp.]|nr:glycosyltransferase [Candidatus Sabulitectum sp.]